MPNRDGGRDPTPLGALQALRASAEDDAKTGLATAIQARQQAAAAAEIAGGRRDQAQAAVTAARAERGRPIARRAHDLTVMRAREQLLVSQLGEREQALAAAREALDQATAGERAAAARLAEAARDREVLERHQGRVAKREGLVRERKDEATQDDARPRKK